MATLEQLIQFQIALTGEAARKFGEKGSPTELTVTGQVWDSGNFPVAENFGNFEVWATGNGGLTSFQYLLFTTDADVFIEIVNITPNPDERAIFQVKAGAILCIPSSVMGGYASNTTRFDGSTLVLNTDYGTINSIRVQRNVGAGSGAATCRLMLVI